MDIERQLVLPNFPYRGKFTTQQLKDISERVGRVVPLMFDAVGPNGALLNIPADAAGILAFHLVCAGVDAHTDHRQLIEGRVERDSSNLFEVTVWRPRGEFPDPPAAENEASIIAAQMKSQLTPEVRAALMVILRDEFAAASEQTQRQRAANVLAEHTQKEDSQ